MLKNRIHGILLILDSASIKYIKICSLSSLGLIQLPRKDDVKSMFIKTYKLS